MITELSIIFIIIFLGYILGRISIRGIELGTSAILLVALVFGHFKYEISPIIGQIGLVFFIGSVGYVSGPVFLEDMKKKGIAYLVIGAAVIISGFTVTYFCIGLFKVPVDLSLGILSGALTSTPCLASSLEVTNQSELVSIGYGIAYVFGVLGVIFFVQIVPKIFSDKNSENQSTPIIENSNNRSNNGKKIFLIDKYNLSIFALSMFLGILVGGIKIPLPGGNSFSLGSSGGPLIMGLIFGNLGKIGKIDFRIDGKQLSFIREFGLVLFLINSGLTSGKGFIKVLGQYGINLFIIGIIITIVPMVIGFLIARYIFKLGLKETLGSLTGAMMSTPALGTLLNVYDEDPSVGACYAATYPIALILLVLIPQFFVMLF